MAYDPRAVKVSKSVKRVAATITDPARRRDFIRGYVKAEENIGKTRSTRSKNSD
jgi:hypothetical protein